MIARVPSVRFPLCTPRALAAFIAGIVILAGCATASAQSIGVRGGVNVSTIKFTPPEALGLDVSGEIGVTAGAFMGFLEASQLSFELGGQLSMRRVAFGPDISNTITYVEVPVMARYAFVGGEGMTIRALGGGSLGFRVAASESVGGDSYSVKDSYKPFDFAVVFGAQAEWKQRWLFEGRYLYGITEAYEVIVGGLESRQRGFQILAGYRLR